MTIKPLPPYNFSATVFKPSHYPVPNEIYEPGKYWFVLRYGGKIYGIKLADKGTVKNPRVEAQIFSQTKLTKNVIQEIVDELSFRFEFKRDLSDFYRRFKRDKVLSPFIKRWNGLHNSCAEDLYSLLMIGILLQNTVVRRSIQMTRAMLEKYGVKTIFDNREVYCFWQPEAMSRVSEDELRALKVGYRAKLFIKLSQTFIQEKIDEFALRQLPIEETKKKLIKLYGVGPETARILLGEAFHRSETFDHVAPWQQKIYSRLLFNKKLVSPGTIIKYIKSQWGAWGNLAASYIWEDIFWRRHQGEKIEWLEKEIRR